MNAATVQAIINLVTALLPVIESGAVTLYEDVKVLLDTAKSSTDATPEQLSALEALTEQSDDANDKSFAAYEAGKPAPSP